MHNIACITQICLFSLFSSLQEDLCLWEGLACCLCSFITLLYLEFVVKQDVKILSPLGLFNPPQPIRTVIRISQISLWEEDKQTWIMRYYSHCWGRNCVSLCWLSLAIKLLSSWRGVRSKEVPGDYWVSDQACQEHLPTPGHTDNGHRGRGPC